MKKYQVWGFNYIALKDGTNLLTGDGTEKSEEYTIPCFNGISVFRYKGKFYKMRYPKIQQLSNTDKEKIVKCCGYEPQGGEYGVIAMTFGRAKEIFHSEYMQTFQGEVNPSMPKKDILALTYQDDWA